MPLRLFCAPVQANVYPGKQGVTIIELLAALAVSALVVTASLSVYWAVSNSLSRQQADTCQEVYAAMDQLRHDLAACAQAPFSNVPAFTLSCPVAADSNAPVLAALAFSVGVVPAREDDFSKLEIQQVRYTVAPDGQLLRGSMTLWGADALAPGCTNAVLQGVSRFDVSVLSDQGWTNQWVSSTRTLLPRAARIRLGWGAASTPQMVTVEVFIPAGNQVGGALKPEIGGPRSEVGVQRPKD